MEFIWDEDKNERIKHRPWGSGIWFEDIEQAIKDGKILQRVANDSPIYGSQRMFIVEVDNYTYKVPFIMINSTTIRLITAYPARKYLYLLQSSWPQSNK